MLFIAKCSDRLLFPTGSGTVPSENFAILATLYCRMPRNARLIALDLPYHITQRGTNRQPVFFSIGDRKLYLRLLQENIGPVGVRVLAWCF